MIASLLTLAPELFKFPLCVDALEQVMHKQTFPKGALLIREGDRQCSLYFVESGMARAYFYDNDAEITSWIILRGEFATVPNSFFRHEASRETIELLTDATVYSIRYDDLQKLYANSPVLNEVGRKIVEHYILQYEWRIRILRTRSTEKRFAMFEQHFGAILTMAQGQHIASFLGITPSTLSRLRSKRARKK